jgi:hypothetical protein
MSADQSINHVLAEFHKVQARQIRVTKTLLRAQRRMAAIAAKDSETINLLVAKITPPKQSPAITADTITIRDLVDLELSLQIATNRVHQLELRARNGDLTTEAAAAEVYEILKGVASL